MDEHSQNVWTRSCMKTAETLGEVDQMKSSEDEDWSCWRDAASDEKRIKSLPVGGVVGGGASWRRPDKGHVTEGEPTSE